MELHNSTWYFWERFIYWNCPRSRKVKIQWIESGIKSLNSFENNLKLLLDRRSIKRVFQKELLYSFSTLAFSYSNWYNCKCIKGFVRSHSSNFWCLWLQNWIYIELTCGTDVVHFFSRQFSWIKRSTKRCYCLFLVTKESYGQ